MTSFGVLTVDVHQLVGKWLRQVITDEYRGVVFGEAATPDTALARIGERAWELVIIDISIPCRNGFYVLAEYLRRWPSTRVLVLTTHANPLCATRALQMGAAGYLCGDAGRSDLVRALKDIFDGKKHFDKLLLTSPLAQIDTGQRRLSTREHDVLLALATGKPVGGIAAELDLSIKTVSTYKRRILDKLHLKSTADMVDYVVSHGLSRAAGRCPVLWNPATLPVSRRAGSPES